MGQDRGRMSGWGGLCIFSLQNQCKRHFYVVVPAPHRTRIQLPSFLSLYAIWLCVGRSETIIKPILFILRTQATAYYDRYLCLLNGDDGGEYWIEIMQFIIDNCSVQPWAIHFLSEDGLRLFPVSVMCPYRLINQLYYHIFHSLDRSWLHGCHWFFATVLGLSIYFKEDH